MGLILTKMITILDMVNDMTVVRKGQATTRYRAEEIERKLAEEIKRMLNRKGYTETTVKLRQGKGKGIIIDLGR